MASTDPFDDVRDAFVKPEHLVDRLLLVLPLSQGERDSKMNAGKVYKFVETTTVVLDGEPDEMVDTVPMVLEGFQFAGQTITGQLIPKIRTGRWSLGRLAKVPSQTKGFNDAWILLAPTDEDKVIAKKYLAENPPPDPFN